MENNLENGDSDSKYFVVDSTKFVLMSICTFGIYELYWNYKNWAYVKNRDQSKIIPIGRAFFYPLWYYSLLTDIAENSSSQAVDSSTYRASLAITLLVFGALWRMPDPYWLVSMLTFLPMLPAVKAISDEYSTAGPIQQKAQRYRPVNFVAFLLGGPLVVFLTFSAIGIFPSTAVVPGTDLSKKQLSFLKEKQILGEDEEISYFYSEGLFSIAEGGQFISNDYVTSYWVDPETDDLAVAYANYTEIEDIGVSWSSSMLDSTIVTVTIEDGGQFELWLSDENRGDRLFVSEMRANWQRYRASGNGADDVVDQTL